MQKLQRAEVKLKDIVTSYDEEVVKRGSEEVKASTRAAAMMHNMRESPLAKNSLNRVEIKA